MVAEHHCSAAKPQQPGALQQLPGSSRVSASPRPIHSSTCPRRVTFSRCRLFLTGRGYRRPRQADQHSEASTKRARSLKARRCRRRQWGRDGPTCRQCGVASRAEALAVRCVRRWSGRRVNCHGSLIPGAVACWHEDPPVRGIAWSLRVGSISTAAIRRTPYRRDGRQHREGRACTPWPAARAADCRRSAGQGPWPPVPRPRQAGRAQVRPPIPCQYLWREHHRRAGPRLPRATSVQRAYTRQTRAG